MRTFGILTKWNDDRAFDFITDDGDGSEVFVHISAFPEMGPRPRLGERLSFEIELGPDGYRQAKYINFPDRLIGRRHQSRVPNHRTPLRFLATLALAIVGGNIRTRKILTILHSI
jgi:cold shock CspA family protein